MLLVSHDDEPSDIDHPKPIYMSDVQNLLCVVVHTLPNVIVHRRFWQLLISYIDSLSTPLQMTPTSVLSLGEWLH